MRIINKFLKKKHILLTLMFTNYGMDGPNQVNTQKINTGNLLALYNIKKQEFHKFFQTIKKIVDEMEITFNIIINKTSENLFPYTNVKSFLEEESKNYNPENYELDILYKQSTFKLLNFYTNSIFTPFLEIDNKTLEKDKTQKNFIRNIIINFNELLKYNIQEKNDSLCTFKILNSQINEYISTMEKYLFFITIEKYLFFEPSDLLIKSILFNLKNLYENADINFKNDHYLTEKEKFVLQQFQKLIRLRNEINKRENKTIIKSPETVEISSEIVEISSKIMKISYKIMKIESEIPSIIKDYNNNTSTVPCIQRLIYMKKQEELEKKKQEELEKKNKKN